MIARITMKHIAKRRARARRPFPICITPFAREWLTAAIQQRPSIRLYHITHKSQALPIGRACFIFRFLELRVADGAGMQLHVADVAHAREVHHGRSKPRPKPAWRQEP